jgi:hypothetical protein
MAVGEGYRNRAYTELSWVRLLSALFVSRRIPTEFQKPNSEPEPNQVAMRWFEIVCLMRAVRRS